MKLDGSERILTSYFGSCLSILTFITMATFMYTKILSLAMKHEVDIMSALEENRLDFDYKFTPQDCFFVAAALTEYDTEKNIIEEERYGELIIEHYGWGYGEGISSGSKAIEYHWCSDEELGFVKGPDTVIFPILESSMGEV